MKSPLRIVKTPLKVLYILVGYAAVLAVNTFVLGRIPLEWVGDILGVALEFAFVYFGTRVFRGRGEAVVPPRAGWRMSAAPPAGFVVAVLLIGAMAAAAGSVFTETTHVAARLGSVAVWGLLAALYLRSSLLLRAKQKAQI